MRRLGAAMERGDTFNKSIAQRPADNSWVFYDGPPFLTGTPHHGHLLVSTVKDTMGRFHTMKVSELSAVGVGIVMGCRQRFTSKKTLGISNKKRDWHED